MVFAALRTSTDVALADRNAIVKSAAPLAADRNAVVKSATALAADGNAVVETTAALEATPVAMQVIPDAMKATASAMEVTVAAIEATVAAIEATVAAIEATASVKTAATASGIGRAGQNHRATQHSRTCGDFPHEVHGCRNSTPSLARSMTFVRHVQQMVNANARKLCESPRQLWLAPLGSSLARTYGFPMILPAGFEIPE